MAAFVLCVTDHFISVSCLDAARGVTSWSIGRAIILSHDLRRASALQPAQTIESRALHDRGAWTYICDDTI